jgi:hypothetical protein
VQFECGDHGGEFGPDVGRHQVGQVARLGHGNTSSSRTAQWMSAFRPSLRAGSTGRLRSRASWIGRLTWLAARVTSSTSACRGRVVSSAGRASESDRFDRALADYRQVVDQGRLQAPELGRAGQLCMVAKTITLDR